MNPPNIWLPKNIPDEILKGIEFPKDVLDAFLRETIARTLDENPEVFRKEFLQELPKEHLEEKKLVDSSNKLIRIQELSISK